MKYLEVQATDIEAIKDLSRLASKIVKEHYDPILGETQNDYMIEKFQSAQSINQQLQQNYKYFFVVDQNDDRVGFIAFYPRNEELYLSKFYLKRDQRGQGIAKDMFQFLKKEASSLGLKSIVLNVNKYNDLAIRAYERLGFIRIGKEKIPIGNDYYMDDYIYEFSLE